MPKPKPFDYDAKFQLKLLRVLYQDANFALSLGQYLSPDHFDKRAHRFVAKHVLEYVEEHGHCISDSALRIEADRAYRSGRLQRSRDEKGVTALIGKLDRKPKDRTYIKKEVFKFVKNQTIKDAVLNGIEHLKTGDFDAIDTDFQKVLDVRMSADGGMGHNLVGDRRKRRKARENYEPNGVATGTKLDDYMKPGGLPPGQLGGVIAPPSAGKTNTLIHFGRSAILESQTPVLHFSLELSEDIINDRYDAAFTGIPINDLELGRNPRRVDKFMHRLGKDLRGEPLHVKEFPAQSVSVRDLLSYVRQLERQAFYPGMIIVDYADLLKPAGLATGDKYTDVGNIYVELRALAQVLQVPIWTAGQGNRNSLGKKILTMKELADSFQKAMHADVLIALCQTEDEKMRKRARYFMMKNRNGQAEMEVSVKLNWAAPRIIPR